MDLIEPGEAKVARSVLRGRGGGDFSLLPDLGGLGLETGPGYPTQEPRKTHLIRGASMLNALKAVIKRILRPVWRVIARKTEEKFRARTNELDARFSTRLDELDTKFNDTVKRIDEELARISLRIPLTLVHPFPDLFKKLISTIAPMKVEGKPLVRIGNDSKTIITYKNIAWIEGTSPIRSGNDNNGGYVMLDHQIDNSIAYNFGRLGNVTWDLALLDRGCTVFQYDHTINRPPVHHPDFHFSSIEVSWACDSDKTPNTVEALLHMNGHNGRNDLLMRMNLEGNEWDVLQSLDVTTLAQFSQIIVEFHKMFDVVSIDRMQKILAVFNKLHEFHQVIHLHGSNNNRIGAIEGIALPDLLEITFVRRDDLIFTDCTDSFPRAIDRPNNPSSPDYLLGMVGMAWHK